MKIPEQIALYLQFNLYLISIEPYCPDLFVCNHRAGNTGRTDENVIWQLAVDTIHRCLESGILNVWNAEWMRAKHISSTREFSKTLAQHNPFNKKDFERDGATYWLEPLLVASTECQILISKYRISEIEDDRVCIPFVSEIENLFEKFGVAWSTTALFPIR